MKRGRARPDVELMRTAMLKAMVIVGFPSSLDAIPTYTYPPSLRLPLLLRQFDSHLTSGGMEGLERHLDVEAMRRLRSPFSLPLLTSRCCAPQPPNHTSPLWWARVRALSIAGFSEERGREMGGGEPLVSSELAVGALELKVQLLYKLDLMERALTDVKAQEKRAQVSHALTELAHISLTSREYLEHTVSSSHTIHTCHVFVTCHSHIACFIECCSHFACFVTCRSQLSHAPSQARVEERVRQQSEDNSDFAGVKRLLLGGRIGEVALRVRGVVQQSLLDTKRDAMMQMVQSGALPIGIKQARRRGGGREGRG